MARNEARARAMISGNRLIQVPTNILLVAAGFFIILMMIHVCADIIGKFVFNFPIEGTLEIVSGYYMVGVIFFPLAYVSHHEGHIKVELFTQHMRPRPLAWLEAVIGIIGFVFMAWFCWQAVAESIHSTVEGEQWETADDLVTIWPSRWVMVVGIVLMTVYLLFRIVDEFRTAASKDQLRQGST